MKLLTSFLTLLYSTSVLAQDPDNCNTEDKERKGSDFVLRQKDDSPNVPALRAIFAAEGRLVNVSDVFRDGNRKMTTHPLGNSWTFNPGDADTEKWMPQGITSTADALDVGTYEGYNGWLVSWFTASGGKDVSARITFIDRDTLEYRHALLVYPHALDDFKAIEELHTGGIMWYGHTLWVVDTNNGIRVFDLDNIWHVDSGDGVGKKAGGGYSAQGYKYVVPQVTWYEWTPDFKFRFSYMSLDRTSTPDSILVGEYQEHAEDNPIRHVKWDLDYTMRRLRTDDKGLAAARWAYCVNIDAMQGAVQADENIYISASNGPEKAGEIFTWRPGGKALATGGFPAGPEDLTYDKRTKEIFTVTEHPGNRWIVGRKIQELQLP